MLNSWLIPNDSRQPTDKFDELSRQQGWTEDDTALVRDLRNDLRRLIESASEASAARSASAGSASAASAAEAACLNDWIGRLAVRPTVTGGDVRYSHEGGPAGDLLAAVLGAVGAGTWKRLKACPDCHWVFYDHTRNGSKRWCLMYAGGPEGRACGTIAKVRRYRDKQRA